MVFKGATGSHFHPSTSEFRSVDPKDNVHSVALDINLLETLPLSDIIKSDVRRPFLLLEGMLDPQNVFFEPGLAHPREPDPDSALIERQNSAAPSEHGIIIWIVNLMNLAEIDDLLDLEAATVGNHNPPVHRREIDAVTTDQAVMWSLDFNPDGLPRTSQADCISLRKPRNPYFFTQLKDCIWMGLVRLCAFHLAIIDVRRESRPGGFSKHIPLLQHLPAGCDFHHHVQAGICY